MLLVLAFKLHSLAFVNFLACAVVKNQSFECFLIAYPEFLNHGGFEYFSMSDRVKLKKNLFF